MACAGAGRGRHGVCAGALAAGEALIAWELGSASAGWNCRAWDIYMHGEWLKIGVEKADLSWR